MIRPYSIVGGTTTRFQLGIALEEDSRGGSRYLHEVIQQEDKILVGKLTESVPFPSFASNHILLAGVSVFSNSPFPIWRSHEALPIQVLSLPNVPQITVYSLSSIASMLTYHFQGYRYHRFPRTHGHLFSNQLQLYTSLRRPIY